MATISMCAPVEEPPFLTLTLTKTEAKALRTVLSAMDGGYGSPLRVSTSLRDNKGELRVSLNAIWAALDEERSL